MSRVIACVRAAPERVISLHLQLMMVLPVISDDDVQVRLGRGRPGNRDYR